MILNHSLQEFFLIKSETQMSYTDHQMVKQNLLKILNNIFSQIKVSQKTFYIINDFNFRSSRLHVFLMKGVLKYAAHLQENTHAEV